MGRRLRLIFAFMLAGAFVNVAVAWGLALWGPHASARGRVTPLPEREIERLWTSHGDPGWPAVSELHRREWGHIRYDGQRPPPRTLLDYAEKRFFGNHRRVISVEQPDEHTQVIAIGEHSIGWPVPALTHTMVRQQSRPDQVVEDTLFTGVMIREGWPQRILPLRPAWPGFLVNTLLYGAVAALLSAIPGRVRARLRRRRNLCPTCAYPIGESASCSECGNALQRRSGSWAHARHTTGRHQPDESTG